MIEQRYEVDTSVSVRTFYTIEIQTDNKALYDSIKNYAVSQCDIYTENPKKEKKDGKGMIVYE